MNHSFSIQCDPDPRVWDDFVAARGGQVLQSAAWGQLKTRFGWSAVRVALARDATLIAGAQILFRRLAPGLTLAYMPRGPIVDVNDHNIVAALFDALVAKARARGAFALKVEPNAHADFSFVQRVIGNWRVATGIQPRTTIHLDLTRDLDAILAQMKPKWRYNIRLAERKGVTVRVAAADDLAAFYQLMQITGARDHFAIHSLAYYRAAFELLGDHARIFIAEYEREPLAAIFVTVFGGEAIYLYGASGNAHRERMPNHALHWAAIQWAKARACARYDFWGVPEERPKTEDERQTTTDSLPSAVLRPSSALPDGLYQFKQGFGGVVVRYADTYDLVFSRWRYALYLRALKIRRGGMT